MFEDILGTKKKKITTVWVLQINNADYCVDVFDVVLNDKGVFVGFIEDSKHVIDKYISYMISMPGQQHRPFRVIVERIDSNTLKFYTPGV
jgi:hypothetical protein